LIVEAKRQVSAVIYWNTHCHGYGNSCYLAS